MPVRRIICLLLLCVPAAGAMSLDLDPAKTSVQFTLHDVLHTVHGTFQLKSGSIRFDPDSGKASGEIVVDVTSGASGSEARDRRMHKEILQSQSQMDVHGVLKIHGADHELTMHFQVECTGGQYAASTHFVIPYVEWGMKNPSTFLLKVDKTVDVDIQTTLNAGF
jgi:polyisoprenoid-binding protein YceI